MSNEQSYYFKQIQAANPSLLNQVTSSGDLSELYFKLCNSGIISSAASKLKLIQARVNSVNFLAPAVMGTPPTLAYSTQSGQSPLGASAIGLPYNTNRVTYKACNPLDNATFGFRDNSANGADAGGLWVVEFDYYGTSFVYNFRSIDSTGGTYQIYVDGQSVAASPFSPTGISPSAGGVYRMQVTFASAAWRRIRIELAGAQFRGIDISPTDSICPTSQSPIKAVIYGDSFVGGALGVPAHQLWAAQAGRILGWEVVNSGQGGTGYTTNGGVGARKNYADPIRIANGMATNPDVVVVFGTVNDNTATYSAINTAAASCFSQFSQASVKTPVIVIGTPYQHTSIPAGYSNARDAVKAAALAADNVAAFIDPLTGTWQSRNGSTGGDGQQWFYGTGYTGNTTGNGNSDIMIGSDNVHPSQAGHDYLARKISSTILDVIASIG